MTPEQVELVRTELLKISELTAARVEQPFPQAERLDWTYLDQRVKSALAALNGEQEEEVWTADCSDVRSEPHGRIVASCSGPSIAFRIASDHNRLPALERAAREVVDADAKYGHMHDTLGDGDIRTGRAWDHMRNASCRLRTALTDKTED